jgi:drug/metabolite transporter (DMT)-like permease
VLVFGALTLGEDASAPQVAGVLAVSAGVFLVSARGEFARRDFVFGLAIALTIASYTLVDARGVDHAEPAAYLALLLTPSAVIYAAALLIAGRGPQMRAELSPRALLTGVLQVGAYGLVLAALRLANAAPVAAVRESSVVIAAVLAAVFLHERVDAGRFAGAVLVAGGVAAIALG